VDTNVSKEPATSILGVGLSEDGGRIFIGKVGIHLQDFTSRTLTDVKTSNPVSMKLISRLQN
jgi:hypothetical protein